jgi:putative component of membrane protein insertase Oxa1/YidC/SpoIIIJ protein YidD
VVGHPLLEGRIQCRYEPTCSEYSIQAVKRLGLRRGLEMTFRRLESCKTDVPLGTYDPVPERLE